MRNIPKMLVALLCAVLTVCQPATAKGRTIFDMMPQLAGYTQQYTYPSQSFSTSASVPTYGGTLTASYTVWATIEHNFYNGNYSYSRVYAIGVNVSGYTYSSGAAATNVTGYSSGSMNTAVYTGTGTVPSVFNFSSQINGAVTGSVNPYTQPTFSGAFTVTGVTP
jgi:hypothetical protein